MKEECFFDICKKCIWIFFTIVVGALWLAALCATSVMGELAYIKKEGIEYSGEHTFYMHDAVLLHILLVILLLLAGAFIRKVRAGRTFKINSRIVVVLLFFLLGAFLVTKTDLYPRSDQEMILRIASDMRNGEFSEFERGGYLYQCPHQKGIVVFCYLTSFLFGKYNYIALQYMNVLFAGGIIYILGKWTEIMFAKGELLTQVLGLAFLPLLFYTTFVYGTIPSLFFALLAILLELQYWERLKVRYAVLAAVCIAFSIWLKSNSLIFLIAMILYWVYMLIHTRPTGVRGFCGVLLVLVPVVFQMGTTGWLEQYSGHTLEKGIPGTAYIAMGLQESQYASGWWNGYNWQVYRDNDYDYSQTNEQALQDIQETLAAFRENKTEGIAFFMRKMLSQWNNPTFQSFDILSYREPMKEVTDSMQSLYTGTARDILSKYMNVYQSVLLSGVLLFTAGRSGKRTMVQLFPAVCFIGGFLFHIFWEAKCQYTLPYFLLLLPYGAMGLRNTVIKVQTERKRMGCLFAAAAVAGILLQAAGKTELFQKVVPVSTPAVCRESGFAYPDDYVMREYIKAD